MKLRMLGKRILVELIIPEGWEKDPGTGQYVKKSAGGIIALGVEGSTFKKNKGIVKQVGDEATKVKSGDKIVFEDYAPVIFDLDNQDIFWIEESGVVAVIED